MVGSLWDELISPFLIGVVPEKNLVSVFRQFIESDFITISEGEFHPQISKLDIDWTEYDWLEYEEIEELLGQQFVIDYLRKESEFSTVGNMDEINELRDGFNKKFMGYVSSIAQRKIDEVNKDLGREISEKEALETRVENLENEKDSLDGKLNHKNTILNYFEILSGVVGFLLLGFGSYLLLFSLPKTESNWTLVSGFLFLIIGLIAILMVIAPDRVTATLNVEAKIP